MLPLLFLAMAASQSLVQGYGYGQVKEIKRSSEEMTDLRGVGGITPAQMGFNSSLVSSPPSTGPSWQSRGGLTCPRYHLGAGREGGLRTVHPASTALAQLSIVETLENVIRTMGSVAVHRALAVKIV